MKASSTWQFAPTGGSPDDGVHNPMIEHFVGNYNYYLAREIIQNSLDAKLDNVTEVVLVEFKLEHFTHTEFPGYTSFNETLDKCKMFWDDVDTHAFIDNAKSCLSNDKIPFLKISDYNTKGLSGADSERSGTWYKLVKSRGSSSKTGGEGGSFGLGKGAPFAASDLRTVFYSTKNEGAFTIFQGIAELVSFEENHEARRGAGSFGDGQYSLRNPMHFPSERFYRRATGTDIYIAGYKNNKGWETDLIRSILRNFWYAIFKNELKVIIQEEEINSSNLEYHLTKEFSSDTLREDVKPAGNPLQYYLAINRGQYFPERLPILGEVSFYFMETEEYLNHVAMMRKSHMVILSRLFRFPGYYAGVFICDNDYGNQELRKMEPPAHDEWIPSRNQEHGKKIFDELTTFIRSCLEKSKNIKKSEFSEVPELYKYLPDNEEGEQGNGTGQEAYSGREGKEETSQLIQKEEIYKQPSSVTSFKLAVLNKKAGFENEDDDEPVIIPPEPEKKKNRERKRKNPANVHDRVYNSGSINSKFTYVVVLRSSKKAKYDLRFYSVGEDLMERLLLTNVTEINGQVPYHSGNYVRGVWLEKNKETRFTVTVDSKFKNAIKLDINEVQ